ncbi:2-aminoethylphosphonate--pyruvate transaminase [Rhodospirillaceae bacterium AH-315-P19]|nr:2-aminoethylphosphonate--pyruvate transaminase [Rhodospirillaceae bacterium AH-315-P19]
MADFREEPLLLTPGPITTSRAVKEAMLRDWGSRDQDFIELTRHVCAQLLQLAGGTESHVCVPIQGSGTFGVEAVLGTLLPRAGKLLVLANGAYGARMAEIALRMGRECVVQSFDEGLPLDPMAFGVALAADSGITHVAAVHCETGAGLLNPIEEIAEVVAKHGRHFLFDAISTFGALPIDVANVPCDAVVASANKCLEGVPGIAFAILKRESLVEGKGNASSLCLDLFDQWRGFEKTGQWRFTPPTHVLAALAEACRAHAKEGGVKGRGDRYRNNVRLLVEGMRELGFQTFLPDEFQAPIIVAFHSPPDPNFSFPAFYDFLRGKGYAIYPGKVTVAPTFRIGCIGQVFEKDIRGVLSAIREAVATFGLTRLGARDVPPTSE